MKTIKKLYIGLITIILILLLNISTQARTTTLFQPSQSESTANCNNDDFIDIDSTFIYHMLIDLLSVVLLLVFIYYPNNKDYDYIFTYFIFNIIIFLLTYLMNEVKMSMGAAFGLFAVFSMLRYRTEGITMKDMTYLFIVIAIGLLSAIKLKYFEILIIDAIILCITYLLDGNLLTRRELSQLVQYDNIEMIKPEKMNELIDDLKRRTGLEVHRVKIKKIDFLKDETTLNIYYYEVH